LVYRKLGGTKGAQYEERIIIFSKEKEMKIVRTLVHYRIVSAM
jgi:hypothetical protein